MRTRIRSANATPVDLAQTKASHGSFPPGLANQSAPKTDDAAVTAANTNLRIAGNTAMAQTNGLHRETTPIDTNIVPPGRVISSSMMRQAEQTPPPDTTQWSSAIGHASTGKSGRVIEKLQQEIDRLNREKQLLKLRYEEAERTTEMMNTKLRNLQDRNSNYESSHEATQRQLQRKERQVTDLREEVEKERSKTARAEDALRAAAISEDEWREHAHKAMAIAQQKEAEYDAIAACRNMDNDRHQNGLNRLKTTLDRLLKQHDEDVEKQKKIDVIAEARKKEIDQLDELTRKLQTNFAMYKEQIDSAVDELRNAASTNDRVVQDKVNEMKMITGQMRWIVNVEKVINGKQMLERPQTGHQRNEQESIFPDERNETEIPAEVSRPPTSGTPSQSQSRTIKSRDGSTANQAPPSPTKKLGLDFRKHMRRGSSKTGSGK